MRSDIRNLFRIALLKFKSVRAHVSVYNADLECQIIGLRTYCDLELVALHPVDPCAGPCAQADNVGSGAEHNSHGLTVCNLAIENVIDVDSYRNDSSRRKSVTHPVNEELAAVSVSFTASWACETE